MSSGVHGKRDRNLYHVAIKAEEGKGREWKGTERKEKEIKTVISVYVCMKMSSL